MSRTIDERVVEMRFDNGQFERETKTTFKTLEKLKEALKFSKAGDDLNKFKKSAADIRLDGIAAGVEALTKRFSTFGIVGMQVVQNVTNALTGKLTAAVNYATDAIVNGGKKRAFNIENAHFQLQALLKDEAKVQEVMANAMESVDGTAYAYDEAAKAASMFAASGIQAGDDMLNALKGITGVAAMTNSEFEAISMIFTTVAGNGRLMGDQLLQLSSRGLNAASTITDYMREVQKMSDITETDIRDMVSDGEISFKTFSDAMNWAFGDSAKRANETFTGAMSNMRSALSRIGAEFISPLIEQNGVMVDMFNTLRVKINDVKKALTFDSSASSKMGFKNALDLRRLATAEKFYKSIEKQGHVTIAQMDRIKAHQQDGYKVIKDYMNGVTDGSIRTSYAVTNTISELSKGTAVTKKDVKRMVKEGKIDLAIFSNAFEEAFGTQHQKLSKRFTDTAIKALDAIRIQIESIDMAKPMALANKSIDIVIHSVQALGRVLTPVGKAFYNVFLKNFSVGFNDIMVGAKRLDMLIKNFKLSEEASRNLERTFTGLFDIIALLGDGVLGLIGTIIPLGGTLGEAGGGVLELTGNLGEALTNFSIWVRTSPKVQQTFSIFQNSVKNLAKGLSTLGNGVWDFIAMVSKMPQTQAIIRMVGDIFSKTGDVIRNSCELIVNSVGDFINSFGKIDLTSPKTMMKSLGDAFEGLASSLMKYDSVRIFVTNFQEFLNNIGDAFSKDHITGKVEAVKTAFDTLATGIKKAWAFISPIFEKISFGGVAATGTGIGIVVSMIKVSKALEDVAEAVKSVPNIFGAVKDTLVAYQAELKSEQIKNIAAAIALLAGSVLLLSFADPARLAIAAGAVSALGGVLAAAMAQFANIAAKFKSVPAALDSLSYGLAKSMNNLTKAVKWKAAGSAMKSIGVTMLMITASIAAIALMRRKDPKAMDEALEYVGLIAAGMMGMMTAMSAIGTLLGPGMKAFAKAAFGVLAISASMLLITAALNEIMKMDIPKDWEKRMEIFRDIFSGLMIMTLVVAAASKLAGGKLSLTGPIVALCAMLVVSISSLKKLFTMDIPKDWKTRFLMFEGIFGSLAVMTIAIAAAARLAGGNKATSFAAPILALCALLTTSVAALKGIMKMKLPDDFPVRFAMLEMVFLTLGAVLIAVGVAVKDSAGALKATGTILAMCAFLATATASLMILSMISWGGLMKGATALGVILVSLATTLYAAGNISNDNTYKAVIGMAAVVGAITASLGILSMIPLEALAKSVGALGVVLLTLAVDFLAISKITNEKVWIDILAMVGMMTAVIAALVILSYQPWEGLLAAGVALSAVILSLSVCMRMVSKSSGIKMEKMQAFALGSLAFIPMVIGLAVLANQPWEGLLAGAASLSAVILAFTVCMRQVSKSSGIKMEKMQAFVLASLALIPMVIGLAVLAHQPWEGLLAATAALSITMLSLSAALMIISKANVGIKQALSAIASLDLFIANLAGVVLAFGALNQIEGFQELIVSGGDIFQKIGEAFGKLIAGFGEGVVSTLPAIAQSLSMFGLQIQPFIISMKTVDKGAIEGVKSVSSMVIEMSKAALISGVTSLLTLGDGFSKMGERLVAFGPYIRDFGNQIKGIDPVSVAAAAACGQMIAKLYEALPKSGGWMQTILGESMSLADFGKELVLFGPSIQMFAFMVKDVKPEAVEGAAAAAGIIAEIYDKLPKSGGWMQTILGESMSLSDFGAQLADFGPSIRDFAECVKDVKPEAVEGAASAASMMAELAEKLPKTGGLAQAVFGETTDLATFGEQLIDFGTDLKKFAKKVADIQPAAVRGAAAAATIMATLAEGLPDTETLGEKLFGGGTMTLSEFGEQLVEFAPYIVNFVNGVKDIKAASVAGAMAAVTLITSTMTTVTNNDMSSNALSKFGKELEKFGKSLVNFYKEMTKTDFSNVGKITQNISKLVKVATDTGNKTVDAFVKAFSDVNGSIKMAIVKLIDKATDTLKASKSKFKEQGKDAGKSFVDGITHTLQNSLTKMKASARNLGKNYVQGLAQGIRSNTTIVVSAAKYMAEQTDNQVAKSFDEHSPSKVAEKKGRYYDIGLANGIGRGTVYPVAAARDMAKSVNHAISAELNPSRIAAVMSDYSRTLGSKFDISKNTKHATNAIAELNLSIYGLSKPVKFVSLLIQQALVNMAKTIAKSYKNINKMQQEYEKSQKKQQADQEKQQKQEEKLQEQYEKWVDYYSKSKKERAEAAKEAKKQAKIEAKAYEKVYGGQKKGMNEMLSFSDDYYKKMLQIVRTGNNKILYEDKTLEEAEIDILQRVTDAYQSYMDQYIQKREEFMNQKGFFDAVEKNEPDISVDMFKEITESEAKTKEELFQIAQDQVQLYQNFVMTQNALLSRLDGSPLADYIRDMGVDAYDQLKVINEMTQEELMQYSLLYENTFNAVKDATKIDKLTKETLIQNARDQVQLYEDFIKTQQQLMVRLEGTNLGDYVLSLGIDSLEEMDAILSMTDAELTEYVGLYDQKFAAAGIAAKNQLSDTQKEIEQTIVDILQGIVEKVNLWDWNFDGTIDSLIGASKKTAKKAKATADKELKEYAKMLAKNGKETVGMPFGAAMAMGFTAENVQTMLDEKPKITKATQGAVKESMDKTQPIAKKGGADVAKAGVNGLSVMPKQFYDIGNEAGGKLVKGLADQIDPLMATCEAMIKMAQNVAQDVGAKLAATMTNIGSMASAGFAGGVSSGTGRVEGGGRDLGTSFAGALSSSLKIHSPSRVTAELGDYSVLGFVSAVMSGIASVAKAGLEVGETAASSMKDGLSSISKVVHDDLNIDPVIRPTMDLTEIEKSVNEVNRMFNDAVKMVASGAQVVVDTMNVRTAGVNADEATGGTVTNNYTFTQNNTSPKALSAIDIYRSTKNQFAQFREAVSHT